ncbi:MAG TPA: CCA tRNA nucleotidyltransferase [Candidatus Paceibacterota bacterium]|nr:CCA tRNA nucleotidyltransferase [Candidatus Paceibacterota bacterium]
MTLDSPKAVAKEIAERLQKAGFAAFWVGGCVRDFLLGREPDDFDIATDAKPEQVEKLFKRTVAVGRKFGVMVVVEGGHQFQVATFRAEADYQDGRRPEKIIYANAEADALRRDFTVNGLFYDPLTKKIHDWVGGGKDLRAKIIRTIGKPEERFGEDHLRLLRAVRFAAQLDFEIEPETFAAVKSLAPKIKLISAERIRDELLKLFSPPHAARGLVLLREGGLLEHILPELAATISCEQSPDYHPEGTVFEHIKLMLEKMVTNPPSLKSSFGAASGLLPWAVLLHDIAKPVTAEKESQTGAIHFYGHEKVGAEMARAILNRLRFPKQQIDEVVACVLHHMQFKDVKQMRKSTLRRLLLRATFPLELELHKLDCLGSHGDLELCDFLVGQAEELKKQPGIRPPLLTGKDLIALGMKPGKELGAMLREIREKQLADELKNVRQAKAWAKKQIQK